MATDLSNQFSGTIEIRKIDSNSTLLIVDSLSMTENPFVIIIARKPKFITAPSRPSSMCVSAFILTLCGLKFRPCIYIHKISGLLRHHYRQVDYVSWVCYQDAYACIGQQCLARSLFVYKFMPNAIKKLLQLHVPSTLFSFEQYILGDSGFSFPVLDMVVNF